MIQFIKSIPIKILNAIVGGVVWLIDYSPLPVWPLVCAASGIAVGVGLALHWPGFWSSLIVGLLVTAGLMYAGHRYVHGADR